MTRVDLVVALGLAVGAVGCAGDLNGSDGGGFNDAGTGCFVYITFDPGVPIATPDTTVRAIANLQGFSGVPTYNWTIYHENAVVDHVAAQPDQSEVTFAAPDPGVYQVTLNISGGSSCPSETTDLNVLADGALTSYRLRVSAAGAPPQERTLVVPGSVGEYSFGAYVLDPGTLATGAVRSGATGVPSYLRFIPQGHPDEIVETFAGVTGTFEARVLDQQHGILVVPAVPGYAPRLVQSWSPGQTVIAIGPGSVASGTVTAPDGSGLVGAKVQLSLDGVPSTLTTTTTGGAFSVQYEPRVGALVAIEVTPPAASALPRLSASSLDFNLAQAIQVTYRSDLVLRDLIGTPVKRGTTLLPAERVTVVGTVSEVGVVTAGAMANASGTVRVSAITDAAGQLPSLRAPASPLHAVVELDVHDLAVTPVDLTTGVPAELAAPALETRSGTVVNGAAEGLAGVTIVASPFGPLASAGAQPLEATTTAAGAFTLPFAAGAQYDVRVSDAAGRGAAIVQRITVGLLPATFGIILPPAVKVIGAIELSGSPNPVAGASVQVLCKQCAGVERTRPIAEAASENSGAFHVAVPDPGP